MDERPAPQHRKKLHRWEIAGAARFLTCSTHRRLPLFDDAVLRAWFVAALARTRELHGFLLLAWVLMPEHFHLLIVPQPRTEGADHEGSTVPRILWGLKKPLAQRALSRWREMNHPILPRITDSSGRPRFWQAGGGFDRNVRTEEKLASTVLYIHANPVDRGLCSHGEDWAWSSARWYQGVREGQVPIDLVVR